MKESDKEPLDIFLELAFMAEQETPENKSSFAAFLYKWLELMESCNVIGEGLVLTQKEQSERVAAALADKDLTNAKKMIHSIKQATTNAVRGVMDKQCDGLEYPVKAMLDYDNNGEIVFRFNVNIQDKRREEHDVTSTIFLNLISYLHLEQSRFRRCPKCGKFFYQYQHRRQKFCSKICSDTGRKGKMYNTPI
ncbi:hypothetical protein [Desulfopila inferna]|uniref:hypothetical protein n=1 Tax=Desulfopila inferna TaxID=468528 RepID=UPI00196667BD|nr:hypothetical protein [Desulfopila inferna]MBM9604216.1 hypothetical protein [Desulfopila inferna]